ncbi:hypothetical protein ACF1A5_18875 [Streptomyces sp. NPDC014864]|uniref:hypothetical protein n=1 Tax=Streptomyces sp. NPDC014864 TaxID=3364924 RepID=UPI0036FEF882
MGGRIQVSARVVERVQRDFPDPEIAAVVVELLEEWGNTWPDWQVDRVQSAIVLYAAGDVEQVMALLEVAYVDFRDALIATGFARADWQELMEVAFGTK